jgi:DNA ligase-1
VTDASLKNVRIVESRLVSTYGEAIEHYLDALNRGLEGTILKDTQGVWKDGKDIWQIKLKLEINVDLRIVGFNYGSGKNSGVISSLNCISECGILNVKPTGMDEDMMKYLEENQDTLMDTIMEAKSCGISSNSKGEFSMLHPVFLKLRDDKSVADTFEQIKAIEAASKELS